MFSVRNSYEFSIVIHKITKILRKIVGVSRYIFWLLSTSNHCNLEKLNIFIYRFYGTLRYTVCANVVPESIRNMYSNFVHQLPLPSQNAKNRF